MKRAIVTGATIATLALGGCGAAADAVPTCRAPSLTGLLVQTGERLNPDADGRSLPTRVRVYQLRSTASLEAASFEEVWHAPEETLGEELLEGTELTVFPASETARPVEPNPDARYIAAVAIFREPAGRSWSSVFVLPVDPPSCQPPEEGLPEARVIVALEGSRVSVRGQVLGAETEDGEERGLPDLPAEDAVAEARAIDPS